MNVTVAKSAGFCFGVKRAVDMVYKEAEHAGKPIYTYGPIIHNDEVIKDMEARGVGVVRSEKELPGLEKGVMIIRSHGISRAEEENLRSYGMEIKDATCPFVKKIHRLVEKYSSEGYHILITGNPAHPEVQGICGWQKGGSIDVLSKPEDLEKIHLNHQEKLCLLSQTTFNLNIFQEFVAILGQKGYDNCVVLDTICDATEKRQTEAAELARDSDAMIVIGDRNSSNTQKLFEICSNECEHTYYIQTSSNMDYRKLQSINNVGITAGASTPDYIIEEVSKNVRNEL